MIQRIQSLYLFVSSILILPLWFLPWMERATEDPSPIISTAATLLTLFAVIANSAAIFRYTDREQQIQIAKAGLTILVALLAVQLGLLLTLGGIGTYLLDEAISPASTFLAILLNALAIKAIRSDIEKVRSMDRIR